LAALVAMAKCKTGHNSWGKVCAASTFVVALENFVKLGTVEMQFS